jgi:hypothetical protein
LLAGLDKDYMRASTDLPWPQWYAARIVAPLGT